MVQREAEHAIDFFAIAHIARKRQCALGVTNPVAGGFCSASIARKQGHSGAVVRENSGKRFADSHGSAGHYDSLAGHVDFFGHAGLLSSLHWPVSRWRKIKNTSVTLGFHEHTLASILACYGLASRLVAPVYHLRD